MITGGFWTPLFQIPPIARFLAIFLARLGRSEWSRESSPRGLIKGPRTAKLAAEQGDSTDAVFDKSRRSPRHEVLLLPSHSPWGNLLS